jgi:hypothetical protein
MKKMKISHFKLKHMKHLLLVFLFSGSLEGFSQTTDTTLQLSQFDTSKWGSPVTNGSLSSKQVRSGSVEWRLPVSKPDTIRATLIVYYDRGPAILHTKPGFVVMRFDKDDVYLDDKRRVVKAPFEVLTYKLKR